MTARKGPLSGALITILPTSSTASDYITLHDDGASAPDKAVEKKFGNRAMPPAGGLPDRYAEGWARRAGKPLTDMRKGDHGGRDLPLPDPEQAVPRKRRLTPKAVPTEQTLLVVMTSGKRRATRCALTKEEHDAFMATLELDSAERAEAAARLALIEAVRRDEAARRALVLNQIRNKGVGQ